MRTGRSLIGKSHGFTLVELLVVISIISLLIGMLLPALGSARSAAHVVVCMANQHNIGKSWLNFASDNDDYIPAPGSYGRELMTNPLGTAGIEASNEIFSSPTQPWDWAGALAFDYMGLTRPQKRDERFALLNGANEGGGKASGGAGVFACPANHNLSVPYDGSSAQPNGINGTKFQTQLSMSYSAAREFMWWGQGGGQRPSWASRAGENYWGNEPGVMNMSGNWGQWLPGKSQSTDSGYRPRLERVGSVLSDKFIMADGSRFIAQENEFIDHDVAANAGYGGAFADIGGWSTDPGSAFPSRAWPIGNLLGTAQDMTRFSFRHASHSGLAARGNVLKYDGSVETMDADPTGEFRRPDHWMPSGSTMKFTDIPLALREEYQERAVGVHAFVARVELY